MAPPQGPERPCQETYRTITGRPRTLLSNVRLQYSGHRIRIGDCTTCEAPAAVAPNDNYFIQQGRYRRLGPGDDGRNGAVPSLRNTGTKNPQPTSHKPELSRRIRALFIRKSPPLGRGKILIPVRLSLGGITFSFLHNSYCLLTTALLNPWS